MSPRIGIVGAGPGGLSLARLLSERGIGMSLAFAGGDPSDPEVLSSIADQFRFSLGDK